MNIDEGKDLVKMAVAVLLFSLVIGAGLSVWYMLFSKEQELQSDLQQATNSATMERLYELQDISYTAKSGEGNYPLVTNVVSTLSEFNEQDLLFIYVDVTQNGSNFYDGSIFTYEGVTLADLDTGGLQAAPADVITSSNPLTLACKKLLAYSSRRCFLELFETEYGDMTYTGIRISVVDIGG